MLKSFHCEIFQRYTIVTQEMMSIHYWKRFPIPFTVYFQADVLKNIIFLQILMKDD